jgi:hypothetical protein
LVDLEHGSIKKEEAAVLGEERDNEEINNHLRKPGAGVRIDAVRL